MMPLKVAIREYFSRSDKEADDWIKELDKRAEEAQKKAILNQNPNRPGPQDGTGVNPQKKGSEMGLNSFHGLQNK